MFRRALYEDIFFLANHMKMSLMDAWNLVPFERRWFIDRYVEFKTKENEAIEKSMRK